MFPPSALPLPGQVLLITDELLAPADFLLHRFLSDHLKESKHSPALLVSVSEDVGRWKSIAGRSNVSLAAHVDSGLVGVIDAMAHVVPALENDGQRPLRALFYAVRHKLDYPSDKKTLVILDDVASLEWIGIPVEEVARFARVLCALCRQRNASLVLRYHVVTPGEPDELFKRLLQLSNYHMDVCPLSSGRSGSVSGQVALHLGPASAEPECPLVSRNAAVHYRLTDSGSMFFDRGTGNSVL
ncbi:hypothetical protein L227DRAFT_577033 [Lentinus tigrinus ALCF2SS1-6]|uniref:Elongator complex protein 5 n=1 Tax=Lentinus tigrinus ALCF2SS1-6 TaxID=1328759 RepID=A0A5C2S660_9APHY|nr:hypothetical protein L227DRAFT_577033 [Lentinus tigrinus ALCF2SS1-6]